MTLTKEKQSSYAACFVHCDVDALTLMTLTILSYNYEQIIKH